MSEPSRLPQIHYGSMMRRMSFSETIFLFLLALLVFGPKKLPEIGRQIGKILNEFRRASNEFRAQIEAEISQAESKHQQILPPSEPPAGVVASLPLSPEPSLPITTPEPWSNSEPNAAGITEVHSGYNLDAPAEADPIPPAVVSEQASEEAANKASHV